MTRSHANDRLERLAISHVDEYYRHTQRFSNPQRCRAARQEVPARGACLTTLDAWSNSSPCSCWSCSFCHARTLREGTRCPQTQREGIPFTQLLNLDGMLVPMQASGCSCVTNSTPCIAAVACRALQRSDDAASRDVAIQCLPESPQVRR